MLAPTSCTAIGLVQAPRERSRGEASALEGVVVMVVVAELGRQRASEEALVAVPSCPLGTSQAP